MQYKGIEMGRVGVSGNPASVGGGGKGKNKEYNIKYSIMAVKCRR